MSVCNLCPRACKVVRRESITGEGQLGYCQSGMLPVISRAALHHWEEPCIAGTRGAGTVFFAGCNLSCVYCQNYEISERRKGIEVSVSRLREIYFELITQGAHNIDLVTPTHYTHAIFQSLREPLPVPVVFYAFLYGALGALVSKIEDLNKSAGSAQMIIMIVYFVVLLQLDKVDGVPMKVCSFLPFSSYSAMFARVAMGHVQTWEIIVSAVILYISVAIMGVIGGKIFRSSTLRYGNPIKLTTAIKNLRKKDS